MSKDKNNIAIADTTNITHLINELRVLDTQVLNRLENKLIPNLKIVIAAADLAQTNLNKTVKNAELVKNEIVNAQKNIKDNVEILNQIFNQFKDFESKNEQMLELQTQKVKNLKEKIELESTIINGKFEQDLQELKSKLLTDVDTQIQKINEEINSKLKGVDLRLLDGSNRLVSSSLSQLDQFKLKLTQSQRENKILFTLLSFIGGVILTSLFFYFFN
ncbi:hypothetical protein GCM10012288_07720 [Malaciobacter pacificus]|uniref:Uncharacterized protein n=1 Tax=Malaciobacter pacificus TaxID=1080223 RepID=A0A5C2H8B9_9BACT|nr:hypothetical protein [Malaciobacter pacificus]QEP35177.1 hypothetical protein APAC_2105 [Malaciobacter pacificus]GGD36184.1 hypothetical protein GCM10012288_07720 [Malaciobacter pacificus]